MLVTGAAGMLGRRVVRDAARRGWETVPIDIDEADLTDLDQTISVVQEADPDAVIHCAGWTDVDGAEEREADALRVNELGSRSIGRAAQLASARVVAVSTDYVFDGAQAGRAYVESDPVSPVGAYGRTKLAGEKALAEELDDHIIARTAWLFGWPGKSFPGTMIGLGTDLEEVAVVTDQVGSPTWTGHLAPALLDLAASDLRGVVHTTGDGQCSWHELTVELYRQAGIECTVNETTAEMFKRPAPRPAWSVLDSERAGVPKLPSWKEGVAGYLNERGLV